MNAESQTTENDYTYDPYYTYDGYVKKSNYNLEMLLFRPVRGSSSPLPLLPRFRDTTPPPKPPPSGEAGRALGGRWLPRAA